MRFVIYVLSCSLLLCAASAESPFAVSAMREHQEVITESVKAYRITVGGTADMDNTTTRDHGGWAIAFQNNCFLRIENTGAVPVVNPRIILNDRGRWHCWESMLEEFTRHAQTDQERIYAIYEGLRNNRHHDYPLFADDEYHDPVRFLNIYGGGFCDDSGKCGSALFHQAGFARPEREEDPFVRALHGHMMCEVWYDGAYQFIDIDQDTWYLDRENKKPVSGEQVALDHDYAKREQAYGPAFQPWHQGPHTAAALFGIDDDRSTHGVWGHRMDSTLRPGEAYCFRWDNIGKYPWKRQDTEHRFYGNSRIDYTPRPNREAFSHLKGFAFPEGVLTATGKSAAFEIETESSYTLCGAGIAFDWTDLPEGGSLRVLLADRQGALARVWESRAASGEARLQLDEALGIAGGDPRRAWRVRLEADAATGLEIAGLKLTTDLYAYPIALPRLCIGENQAEYSDESSEPHEITVTHGWRESEAQQPPIAPHRPLAPQDQATVRESFVGFSWPGVPGCDAYHLVVSTTPDFRFAYRPNYDLILEETEYCVPYRGMFSDGATYYWRVRPRLSSGLWGAWSPAWTFRWEGPMAPGELELYEREGDLYLRWQANPAGRPPVAYDIYASDERGFSVSKAHHYLPVLGECPPNFLGARETSELLVAGPHMAHRQGNRAFYRVVARDAHGVESCPSAYVEAPRPFVYSSPLSRAKVGRAYAYPVRSLRSRGDLQSRYLPPGLGYWEEEALVFELLEGPAWLELEPDTGLLHGTPEKADIGAQAVRIEVRITFPKEVAVASESGAAFQKRRAAPIARCTHTFDLLVE